MSSAATLAPSLHNSQPWWFRIVGDSVEVLSGLRAGEQVRVPAGEAN